MEQARRSASDPSQGGDATSFLTSLTPDLRRTILSDMDDTQLAQLPEELATEARSLRQERDERSRQLLAMQQARYESQLLDAPQWSHPVPHHHPIGMISGGHHRYQGYTVLDLAANSGGGGERIFCGVGDMFPAISHPLFLQRNANTAVAGDLTGKQILDQDGLACLLVLLFLDQSKIHFNRLFRIFRNLSQHIPSRSWLISSLLSVLKKTNAHTCPHPARIPATTSQSSHWLNMTINAALGSHVSVFQFSPSGGKVVTNDVLIHPHASISICSNVLELLIFLARQFPASFLPPELVPKDKQSANQRTESQSNFWQILFKLDSSPRKGKGSVKGSAHADPSSSTLGESDMFSVSPIGSLMRFFEHPVVQGSVNLVDKLLRVLSVISGAIPKHGLTKSSGSSENEASKSSTDTTATAAATTSAHKTPSAAATDHPRGLEISGSPLDPAKLPPSCYSSSVVSISLLHSVINLLTSGKCTEDSLDDATNLLINLSRCSPSTREAILLVLLEGVQKIGYILADQISVLLAELTDKMASLTYSRQSSGAVEDERAPVQSNIAPPSLGTTEGVVLPTLQGRGPVTDHSQDLHLSCMEPMVCKGSQQSFFLRLLKVVCQLRESSQSVLTVGGARRGEATSLSSFLLSQSPMLPVGEGVSRDSVVQSGPPSAQEGGSSTAAHPPPPATKPPKENSPFTSSLSLQLELEGLWVSLSDCLDALAGTYDPHAVLLLQPTVEAFFLVHADQSEEVRSTAKDRRSAPRGRRLPSFHTISDTESNVGSPLPYDSFSPAPVTRVRWRERGQTPSSTCHQTLSDSSSLQVSEHCLYMYLVVNERCKVCNSIAKSQVRMTVQ